MGGTGDSSGNPVVAALSAETPGGRVQARKAGPGAASRPRPWALPGHRTELIAGRGGPITPPDSVVSSGPRRAGNSWGQLTGCRKYLVGPMDSMCQVRSEPPMEACWTPARRCYVTLRTRCRQSRRRARNRQPIPVAVDTPRGGRRRRFRFSDCPPEPVARHTLAYLILTVIWKGSWFTPLPR